MFWHLNPTKLKPFKEAYEEKCKQQDLIAWYTGRYVMEAIASCFGKHDFSEQPYSFKANETNGLSDAEKFEMWAKKFNQSKKNNQ